MRNKQLLIIALIILFALVVSVGVLILNWLPQEVGKQLDQIPSTQSTLLASQPGNQLLNQVPNQPVNQSTSHSLNQETAKVNGKDSNISSDSAEERPLADAQVSQQNNEQTSARPDVFTQPDVPQIEDIFDRIERSIKETLSKASLVPIKS